MDNKIKNIFKKASPLKASEVVYLPDAVKGGFKVMRLNPETGRPNLVGRATTELQAKSMVLNFFKKAS